MCILSSCLSSFTPTLSYDGLAVTSMSAYWDSSGFAEDLNAIEPKTNMYSICASTMNLKHVLLDVLFRLVNLLSHVTEYEDEDNCGYPSSKTKSTTKYTNNDFNGICSNKIITIWVSVCTLFIAIFSRYLHTQCFSG